MHLVNVTLDSYNILLGIILLFSIILSHYFIDKYRRCFLFMVVVNIVMSASDILTMLFEGPSNPVNFKVLPIAMFVFYLMSLFILMFTILEITILLNQDKKRKVFSGFLVFSSVLYLTLLGLTPFTNLLYTIDENNIYSRGQHFYFAIIIQLIIYLDLIVYLFLNRKSIHRKQLTIILCFIVFPQVAQIIQLAFYGLSLINTGYSMAFIIMFIYSNRKMEGKLETVENALDEKEMELQDKSVEIEGSKLMLIKMKDHTIESLSNLVENRDEDTGEHVRRTRTYVEMLAVQMMKNGHYPDILTPRYVRFLKRAAPMHDIGKIVVPDAILKKHGRFTPEEFEQMKRHASEGGRIVHQILDGYEDPEYIKITADIATHHHEKWDGTGYPDNLAGEDIPLCARIMALADVFDALVSPRIYKSPMSYEDAFAIIEKGSGIHFDPIIAEEFMNIKEKAAAINESYKVL